MASALRETILGHLRVPVVVQAVNGSKLLRPICSHQTTVVRPMSSHNNHLEKNKVVNRILDIVKSFPKVDPSKDWGFSGVCFVRYKYADEAQKAVEKLDGRVVDGKEIMVQFSKYGPDAE